ncbi:MAG: ABC transporter ATP-binding protein [Thermodesulfobacteriota bacterium]|nr:ABC transporter ATP-binding protein [Thermodesulfobacteriota bacterium]
MSLQPILEKPSTLLRIRDLHVSYGKVKVIKDLSLELKKGEIVAVIGSNGAGKSTFLKTISGFLSPTQGEIWFDDKKIGSSVTQNLVKAGIVHILEGKKVFPQMTTLENLKMGAFLRKDRGEIMNDLDRAFQHFPVLKERQKQQAGSLSGGEQQMVALGRALMGRPKLLLLDEPSLGLSPIMAQEMANIVVDINREGVSIILVEQNARLALSHSHKGYVMEMGKIVLQGTPDELLDNEDVRKAYLGV